MLKATFICALLGLAALAPDAEIADAALQPIQPVPQYYLLDEAGLLNSQQQKAIATILIEHDRATGEQIVVAIFKHLPKGPDKENATRHARRVFDEWQIGKRGQDNGALLAVYVDEKVARLEAGYGLDKLDNARASGVIRDFMMPELRAGHPFRAVGLSVLEILRAIDSPLIESGRAEQLLDEGGIQGELRPVPHGFGTGASLWWAILVLGLGFFALGLYSILAAEAHFTGEGWFKPNPWKMLAPKALLDRKRAPMLNEGGIHGEW